MNWTHLLAAGIGAAGMYLVLLRRAMAVETERRLHERTIANLQKQHEDAVMIPLDLTDEISTMERFNAFRRGIEVGEMRTQEARTGSPFDTMLKEVGQKTGRGPHFEER